MSDIYQARFTYNGVDFTADVNGFPVMDGKTAADNGSGAGSAPLNPFLIGKGNVLRIEVKSRGESPVLEGGVDRLKPGDWGETAGEAHFKLEAGDVIEHTFDSDIDNFSALLNKAQPGKPDDVVAYALKIRDTLNSGDAEAAMAMLKPKFESLAASMGAPYEMILAQADRIVEALMSQKHTFEAADVNAQACCDNKLWRLLRPDGEHLVGVKDEDGSMNIELTVAILPDGPAVVL